MKQSAPSPIPALLSLGTALDYPLCICPAGLYRHEILAHVASILPCLGFQLLPSGCVDQRFLPGFDGRVFARGLAVGNKACAVARRQGCGGICAFASLGQTPGVELLGQMGALLTFSRTAFHGGCGVMHTQAHARAHTHIHMDRQHRAGRLLVWVPALIEMGMKAKAHAL